MPEMTVVNTSPLFYLHRLGLLKILHELYGNITVPEAVVRELERGHVQGENVPLLPDYPWIEIMSVSTPEYLNLIVDLGPGESEVLAIATYHPSALVILDDKMARRIAEMQGFRLTGTAGVLLRAKVKGLIPELKPVVEKLLSLDFHLKPELVQAISELAGE
jgi:predicted nucleic acid-binding protein